MYRTDELCGILETILKKFNSRSKLFFFKYF